MANTTQYAQLNIGRNVGTEPMLDWAWEWFADGAANVLLSAARVTAGGACGATRADVQVHYGRGEWDGVAEDSAHVSLFWADGMDVSHIREASALLARMFQQDAIAVMLGSELITA